MSFEVEPFESTSCSGKQINAASEVQYLAPVDMYTHEHSYLLLCSLKCFLTLDESERTQKPDRPPCLGCWGKHLERIDGTPFPAWIADMHLTNMLILLPNSSDNKKGYRAGHRLSVVLFIDQLF